MRVLIIGASGGIGAALAAAAEARSAAVTRLSRRDDGLDVTDEDSIARHLGALKGPFDAVLVATGALSIDGQAPEKTLRALDPQALAAQFALNAIGPALVLKHAAPLLPRQGRAVLAVLSARVGSIGDNRAGGWYGYRAAKAALNQFVHCAAIELGRTHRDLICVALHPGTVQTPLTRRYLGRHPAVPPAEAARNLWSVIDGLTPVQSGGFFDWAGKEIAW
ncbi:MAG: SDR family oxidoreductase [Pararhodobacter sp.]|nr:SDR family oxidoreductase [Pararhodobacter sp.]